MGILFLMSSVKSSWAKYQNVIVHQPTKFVCNLNQSGVSQPIGPFFTLTFIETHCDYNKGFVFSLNAWVWLHLRCFFRHTRHHRCSPVKSAHCWRLHHTAAYFASSCFACSVEPQDFCFSFFLVKDFWLWVLVAVSMCEAIAFQLLCWSLLHTCNFSPGWAGRPATSRKISISSTIL